MEQKINMPLYKRIIYTALSAFILLSAAAGIYILTKRQDSFLYNNKTAVVSAALSDAPTMNILDPDSEVRGVWIATVANINFPSKPGLSAAELKAELDDIVKTAIAAKLNAIYFQVRPTSDALYNSSYFPLSAFLVNSQDDGFPDGFDPFAYLIEIAHAVNIKVHAWVNPLRVTYGTAENPSTDLSKLGVNNPARRNPDWTVPYADGKLYYNAGIPAVRTLIACGVAEIAGRYDVDGVIFDDYFYPYPVSGAVFDDADEYKKYGSGFSDIADWRRDNINKMVQACYNAIKGANADCRFGIAPFGIWQNDDGSNGGSETSGFNSYSQLYCDALAWIKGGYIDYIAPQIYWRFSTSVARFDVLCRWWNARCAGTGVDLLISHGAYRSGEWGSDTEIKEQVEFARSEAAYKGSIHYGYAQIKANVGNLLGQLQALYTDNIIFTDVASDGSAVTVSAPADGSTINYSSTYILGKADPGFALYFEGKPVSLTKKGYFSVYTNLNKGKNTFTFTQNGKDTVYTMTYGYIQPAAGEWTVLDSFKITGLIPLKNYMLGGGESISIQATAPSGSAVTAYLGGVEIKLAQTTNPPENSAYMAANYSALYKLPAVAADKIIDLGNITYKAVRGSESAEATGANVKLKGASAVCAVEVVNAESELKVATDSWYYDDYTPAAVGMRDYAVRLADGYYKLRMGGYIAEGDVKVIDQTVSAGAWITSADVVAEEGATKLYIKTADNVPINAFVADGYFTVTLYNVGTDVKKVKLNDNMLFDGAKTGAGPQDRSFRIYLHLISADNFYGFKVSYENGYTVVSFRNPSTLAEGEKPLTGRAIIVDAGHGGVETGALGPAAGIEEKAINLKVVLVLAKRLEELGANVILTRSDDSTVLINDRLKLLNETEPDLCVSVHQNSMSYNNDITRIRGIIGLYFSDAGKLLTSCVSSSAAKALNRMERTPATQRLAMVRNPKFPSTLIEASFMTSVEEYDVMAGDPGIKASAEGIAEGILNFYREQAKYIK